MREANTSSDTLGDATTPRNTLRDTTIPRATLAGILSCFFISGAAGLIYQVAWGKALGLVFGNTVYAISTILAVFMGGLALGSALLGRWSERFPSPVKLYAWIELLIAAGGALSLLGLAGVRYLYIAAYPITGGFMPALVALRFIGAAIVLLLPTFLMGGTLPILVSGLTRNSAELGARVSRLYWINTLGAVVGTFAAGFIFLPKMGLRLTVALAVALNVIAGAVAWWLARAREASVTTGAAEAGDLPVAPADSTKGASEEERSFASLRMTTAIKTPTYLLVCFAIVGATAIAYEVCWTRLLVTTFGSSTYAFTLMLGTFLGGIVVGSALFDFAFARKEVSLATFALTQTLTAVAAVIFLISYLRFYELVPVILRHTHATFRGLILAQFATSALALLPAAVVFGFNFPVVTVLIAGRPETSGHYATAVGRAYAANTLGAILGATLAGFWLVPLVGAFRLVAILAGINFLLAAYLQLRRSPPVIVKAFVNAVMVVAVAFVAGSGTFYDRAVATFGAMLYYDRYSENLTIPEIAQTVDVVYAADGLNATISVARTEDYISIRTNGKVDASNKDQLTQLIVGHLGAMLHPAPRRVLVIGFGSGMTVASVAKHPGVESVTCVEIEPAVIGAAKYLETLNHGVLNNPRVHIVLDDARNFLLTTREQFDIIVSEPSNPWIAGVSNLFTDEFYAAAYGRLRPGGLFVQWVQAYSLFPQDFQMILATFVPHFPQVSMWRGEGPDYVLLGQHDAGQLTLDRLRAVWSNPALQTDFAMLGLRRPEGIMGFHRLDDADVRRLAAGAVRNTDDRNRLEYQAPRGLLVKSLEENTHQLIWQYRSSPIPAAVRLENPMEALQAAAETFVNLDDADANYFFGYIAGEPDTAELATLRGRWTAAAGKLYEAKQRFNAALQMDPKSLEAADGLASVARRQAQSDTAEILCRQILARDPQHVPALHLLAMIDRDRGNWDAAAQWQAQLLKAKPDSDPDEYSRLGEMLAQSGKLDLAERAFLAALERDPYSYAAHRNLAETYLKKQQWDKAEWHLRFIERFHPDVDAGTYLSLANVFQATGRPQEAVEALRKGLRIFPGNADLKKLAPVTQ